MSHNPYVGVRSFEEQDAYLLFGRDRERQDLRDRLIGRRIVLLHSPSGAGKTSLIKAGLIPLLKDQKLFQILPIIRVNTPPPIELSSPGSNCNRYVLSTILSLQEALSTELQKAPTELAMWRLADYLDHLTSLLPRGRELLIFDQFEEVLTTDLIHPEAKAAFFAQLGEALSAPGRWALFSMRQDYVAALDPYLGPIPYHFEERFPLEFLGLTAAEQAVSGPAHRRGVEFVGDAAKTLVLDLSKVHVQLPDGSVQEQTGPYVEPVFLQVVCQRLWESPRAEPNRISETDIPKIGNVDDALADYYNEKVKQVVEQTSVSEWRIRDWFDRQLITEQGMKSLAPQGSEQRLGITNQVVALLENAYLVREESRSGAKWYELAHDRLINPIRQANKARRQARRKVREQALASLPATVPSANPYPGPRAFNKGEKLFGRDHEALDLLELLDSHRVVFLYGPSGAGKTSLLQALIMPLLDQEDQRLITISGFRSADASELSPAQDTTGRLPGENKYVFSLLRDIEDQSADSARRRADAELIQLDLVTYLAEWRRNGPPDVVGDVLICDDFEEVITLDPFDQEAKSQFFSQLATALADEKRRAILCFDELYLPDLESYLSKLSVQPDPNYRLSHLSPEGAAESIRQPAREANVEFEEAAVAHLVNDLRRQWVQRPDGSVQELIKPTVEAMQLQIICHNLWSRLKPGATKINIADLAEIGKIDEVFSTYYASRVEEVAALSHVSERGIRDWFERQLITSQGRRAQVPQGQGQTGGLDNQTIQLLITAFLVRAELVGGITWYELAHDRLILAVRGDNERWRKSHESLLQQQARLWEQQGSSSGLLLRGSALREAEVWAATNPQELLPSERKFLVTSQRSAQMERRAASIRSVVILVILVLAILSSISASVALLTSGEASRQRDLALSAEGTAIADRQDAIFAYATTQAATNELSLLAGNLSNQVAASSDKIATYEAVFAVLTGTPTQTVTGTATSTPTHGRPIPGTNTPTSPSPSATALVAGIYPQARFMLINPANYEKGRRGQSILAIVNRLLQGSIPGTAQFFQQQVFSSAHYAVGRDGVVVQFVNDLDTAFHAGTLRQPKLELVPWLNQANTAGVGANNVTLAVEWEGMQTFDLSSQNTTPDKQWWSPTEQQYQAGLELARYLVRTYNIPSNRMHIDLASDLDSERKWWSPGEGFPIDRLLADLQKP